MAMYRRAASAIQRRGAQPLLPAWAMASLLGYVEPAPKDPILGVTEAFLADPPSTKSTSASYVLPLAPSSLVPSLACFFVRDLLRPNECRRRRRLVLRNGSMYELQGAYRDDDGKPVVLDCVREAERRIAGNLNMCVRSPFPAFLRSAPSCYLLLARTVFDEISHQPGVNRRPHAINHTTSIFAHVVPLMENLDAGLQEPLLNLGGLSRL
ncbi:hypothetical protein ZWY2020_003459 [Hordeum vulgare]|nr:hypothetical protein ZWY2020_003459 [Hordeum vulgare]